MNQQGSQKIDAYRRASSYPAAGQLYLPDNPLLRRPQAVGERTVRLPNIFRAMARFSPSAPSGHRSPSGASATSPVSGESVSQREVFRHAEERCGSHLSFLRWLADRKCSLSCTTIGFEPTVLDLTDLGRCAQRDLIQLILAVHDHAAPHAKAGHHLFS